MRKSPCWQQANILHIETVPYVPRENKERLPFQSLCERPQGWQPWIAALVAVECNTENGMNIIYWYL
jgi:hypothetical protein